MEFHFNVNEVFKSPIVEITHNLIPPGYTGDRRALWDTVTKVGEIVNQMGSASAVAQGLTKPITTADRIRNSEHKLYFLVDQKANSGKGSVTGMLKTGNKSLYVFDREGNHYQVQPPCLLDFYIHESKQRNGLGKVLFEHMLQKEGIAPIQMAIDRPSDKLLGFLNKHYSLRDPVKQMNNYVVFDNFFPRRSLPAPEAPPTVQSEAVRSKNPHNPNSANGLQPVPSPLGRYAAPRPPCSMGQIIHNQSPNDQRQEATGVQSMPATNFQGYQQSFSPENIAYISQSTPNMYQGQYQGQMPANYQNTPGQNWPQDPNITAQGYGATGQMIQGTPSAYPLQNQSFQNSAQNMPYQNQNMGNYGTPGIQPNLPKEQSTTYLDSYQLPAAGQSDKSNAVYAGSAQSSQMNVTGYQYQQSPDPNAAQQQAQQAANMVPQQQAGLQEATNAQQQATNMAAQQQAANVAAQQQQAANMAAQQQTANMAAQQQAANLAAQQQAANLAAQQQAANLAAQQQAANMAAQQQAANMSTQQQSATLTTAAMAAQQQSAAMAAQQQAAAMAAQQQAAAMAAQQQAAAMTAQQAAAVAAQQQAAAMAAQQQAAAIAAQQQAAQQQVDMAAQEQAAYLLAQQQAANMAAQQQAGYKYAQGVGQNMEQLVPQQDRPQYSAPLLPSVASQGAYQPVQGVQSAPIPPTHQRVQFGAVSPSAPSFPPNLVPSGMSVGHYNRNVPQVPQNFNLAASGDQARRIMSAGVVPTYATPAPSKQEIVPPNMQYPIQSTSNPVQNLQAQNSVEQMQNVGHQYTGGPAGEYARLQNQAQENYKECRPFSAEVCGADRFRVKDSIRKKNDGTDFIKKSTENDLKYGYPPQVSHDVQKAPEQSYTTKLERPRSLIIQQEEPNKKLEKEDEDDADKDSLADSIDIGVEELDIEEPVKEKIKVRGTTENFLCGENKTPSPRKTPSHLTEQGYFDLKFYHNKLW